MNGFEAYQTYQAVRLHFVNEKFDYFTYNGKSKTSLDTFNTRRDKYLFHKIARLYKDDELPYFFAVNFLKRDGKSWVSGLLQEAAVDIFKEWLKWQQARLNNFTNDLTKLAEFDFGELIKAKDNQFPELLNLVFRDEIAYDSLVILDYFIKFMDSWNTKLKDDFIWDDFYKKFKKYKPFFLHYAPLSDMYYKKLIVNHLTIKK